MNFYLLLNTKENIFKKVANQTVDGSHCIPLYRKKYYGSLWGPINCFTRSHEIWQIFHRYSKLCLFGVLYPGRAL